MTAAVKPGMRRPRFRVVVPLTVEWFRASVEEQAIRRCPRCGDPVIRSKFRAIPICAGCLVFYDRVNRP